CPAIRNGYEYSGCGDRRTRDERVGGGDIHGSVDDHVENAGRVAHADPAAPAGNVYYADHSGVADTREGTVGYTPVGGSRRARRYLQRRRRLAGAERVGRRHEQRFPPQQGTDPPENSGAVPGSETAGPGSDG